MDIRIRNKHSWSTGQIQTLGEAPHHVLSGNLQVLRPFCLSSLQMDRLWAIQVDVICHNTSVAANQTSRLESNQTREWIHLWIYSYNGILASNQKSSSQRISKTCSGPSLVVQRLRPRAPSAGGPCSTRGRGTSIRQAMRFSQVRKREKMHSAAKASAKAHTGGIHLFEVQQKVASFLC